MSQREHMPEFIADCLLLDLETRPDGRIIKVGAVLRDRTFFRSGPAAQRPDVFGELDCFASHATAVVGHNLLRHDLPILAEKNADLRLLELPVIDTLFLSPICFPENPYHRLVKDYKLVSESLNDPVADAGLAGTLLADEVDALGGMARGAPHLFACLRALLCCEWNGDTGLAQGMAAVFWAAAGKPAGQKPFDESLPLLRDLLGELSCQTAARAVELQEFEQPEQRWAFAFALCWMRVAGSDSVLPPWVRLQHPGIVDVLERLRDKDCGDATCVYCRQTHHPETQLKRYFGFPAFRDTPLNPSGGSLQRDVVAAGMRNESLLAVLPTGAGKSLCFQLPALVRNFRRGQLTVVVSPLQALMKDQVDGVTRRTGMHNAAALSGLLTPPERGEVLRGVRMGRVALLYISPEQLRSRSFREAARYREIGCWVLDEAHCLSKWGHDFRPDYLYIGRFIRELATAQAAEVPAIACFTATAKRDVIEEIRDYFRRETGRDLTLFQGGVERDNLSFEVQGVGEHEKLPRVHQLLGERLNGAGGTAIVFRAKRDEAEFTAAFLCEQGWPAAFFHAGLPVPEKKRIQDAFIGGDLRVICATNAFGMGIDKENVRLVIHGDTPASLENYLQEAGRAGRDRLPANCVLLYNEDDCERQFGLGAASELTRKDIAQVLRGLRKAGRVTNSEEVVMTTGELLRDEDVDVSFSLDERMADTKVRTAVSWLERAGFVERNENRSNILQVRLLVTSLEEAREKMAPLRLADSQAALWIAILREIMDASATEALSIDRLALLPEAQALVADTQENGAAPGPVRLRSHEYLAARLFKILRSMSDARLVKKETLLTAFLRYKVQDHSELRLRRVLHVDEAFLKLLTEEEPDPEGWLPMNLRRINDALLAREVSCSTEMLRGLLRSLCEDGRGFAAQSGSLDVRHVGRDEYRVRVRRPWAVVTELAGRRRRVASVLLESLLETVPPGSDPSAQLLVSFSFEQLEEAIDRDLTLRSEVKDRQAALERGLMYLHEQGVIVLQQGLAIFRSAMTVRLLPEARGQRFTRENFQALQLHYDTRVFQVHVMNEYARRGLERIRAALELVRDYFGMDRESFIGKVFADSRKMIERATTARSYRAIVDSLGNRDQIRIVTRSPEANLLVLAGPGSGKTRTVVHRCAYLLRVKRVRPRAILICCFNHKAAIELRRRLAELVGRDAIGVTILTYHALALRLLGHSCRGISRESDAAPDFDAMIEEATRVLRGDASLEGVDPDDARDRLLTGFEHILVDEYQDIDEGQYRLVESVAGRTLNDPDRKLSILAVGDDDQSIYGFRNANVKYIRQFQADYGAECHYLVENYRSTRAIIEAANQVIRRNRDRMKTDHEIGIDQARRTQDYGGILEDRDGLSHGRVVVVKVDDAREQAASILREAQRLHALGAADWSGMAVLSRTSADLAWVRAEAEAAGIPVSWPMNGGPMPSLARVREWDAALRDLCAMRREVLRASDLIAKCAAPATQPNVWQRLLRKLLDAWETETGNEPTLVDACVEFLYESLAQRRRDEQFGDGLVLSTIHAAKGTEFEHVLLCGDWPRGPAHQREEERRVLYVGMTRARQTLSVFARTDRPNPFLSELTSGRVLVRRESYQPLHHAAALQSYEILRLEDLFIDYAGRYPPDHPIHTALFRVQCGDTLHLVEQGSNLQLAKSDGRVVACLSASGAGRVGPRLKAVASVKVVAMLVRRAEDVQEATFLRRLRCKVWEIPLCELTFTASSQPRSDTRPSRSLSVRP